MQQPRRSQMEKRDTHGEGGYSVVVASADPPFWPWDNVRNHEHEKPWRPLQTRLPLGGTASGIYSSTLKKRNPMYSRRVVSAETFSLFWFALPRRVWRFLSNL